MEKREDANLQIPYYDREATRSERIEKLVMVMTLSCVISRKAPRRSEEVRDDDLAYSQSGREVWEVANIPRTRRLAPNESAM